MLGIRIRVPDGPTGRTFPFTVPAIAGLESLEMEGSVTVLVGENGTGKSTFLEALALAARLPAVGGARREG
ncbi:MAG: ATP-binding cassette domain-containing protein, partial [Gemmatimonadetes bacterium]|nr:ATP-binding cassette domain-containing protein [Gemmatimonadota bacterium]